MSFSVLQAAADEPERVALVLDGREISFAELAARVLGAIDWFGRQGVGAERAAPVAVVGETTAEVLITLHALFEIGVPVALVHPRSPEDDRRRWLGEIGADVLLDPSTADFQGSSPDVPARVVPDDERPMVIARTSGSSGRPKGVVLSRRAFASAAAASARNLDWRDDDRWLLSLPVAHVGGLSILTRCLAARRAVVVRSLPRFDAESVAEVIERDRVTLLSLVPTMLRRLLELEGFALPEHLRAVLLGGAAAPPALLERAADRGWPVLTTYGLTEACSQVATQRYGTVNQGELGCGEPVDGMGVRINDGVVEIRGRNLMSGYLPAGDVPPRDEEGWLTTGDLGRLDEAGRLHLLGRRDDVIVTGGENVHPVEVEAVLEDHPGITAACVFGVDDADWGQAVAAAVVAGSPPEDGELLRHLRGRLASHQVPRRIAYVERLPKTDMGKVDRRGCARLAGPRLRLLGRVSSPEDA